MEKNELRLRNSANIDRANNQNQLDRKDKSFARISKTSNQLDFQTPSSQVLEKSVNFSISKSCDLSLTEVIFIISSQNSKLLNYSIGGTIDLVLKGALLIELGFAGRIELDSNHLKKVPIEDRKIVVKSDKKTGEYLLDQSLEKLKSGESELGASVIDWIRLLNGDTWNPFKIKYRIGRLRETISKNLVDKGVSQYNNIDTNYSGSLKKLISSYYDPNSSCLSSVHTQVVFYLFHMVIDIYTKNYNESLHLTNLKEFVLIHLINIGNLINCMLPQMSISQFKTYTEVYKQTANVNISYLQTEAYHRLAGNSDNPQQIQHYKQLEFVLSIIRSLQMLA